MDLLLDTHALLNISFQHILEVTNLDFHHRDPFDRIIIAQAIIEDLKIVGKDSVFKNYPIELIW